MSVPSDIGLRLTPTKACGEVESMKSVSAVYAPIDDKLIEINDAVLSDPQVINEQPYLGGWLFKATVLSPPGLLSADAYQRLLAEERPDAR